MEAGWYRLYYKTINHAVREECNRDHYRSSDETSTLRPDNRQRITSAHHSDLLSPRPLAAPDLLIGLFRDHGCLFGFRTGFATRFCCPHGIVCHGNRRLPVRDLFRRPRSRTLYPTLERESGRIDGTCANCGNCHGRTSGGLLRFDLLFAAPLIPDHQDRGPEEEKEGDRPPPRKNGCPVGDFLFHAWRSCP
jgi:hypothetical protein